MQCTAVKAAADDGFFGAAVTWLATLCASPSIGYRRRRASEGTALAGAGSLVAGTRSLLFEGCERSATLACSPQSRTEASVNPTKIKPTVARIWRGRTTRANADAYAVYLYEHGVRRLEEKALGVQQLREDRAEDTEFVTISYWESVEAMSRFAGPDPRRIHHLERDAEFLIELPQGVQVLQITASKGVFGT
jgi:hypothetical protein